MATISTLAPYVLARIEETNPPVFWSLEEELYSALQEAQCDLMLLLGRPDLTVVKVVTIQPYTTWQPMPKGMFCITNMQGPASEVWKIRLQDLDYGLVSGPDWEQDVATDAIRKWFPVGLNMFGVWPVITQEQYVLVTGIAAPITSIWPFDGTQAVVFHDEQFQALEKYAAAYLRLKESGLEFEEGEGLYQLYLQDARRLSQLEDRRDPYIFEGAIGGQVVVNPTKKR